MKRSKAQAVPDSILPRCGTLSSDALERSVCPPNRPSAPKEDARYRERINLVGRNVGRRNVVQERNVVGEKYSGREIQWELREECDEGEM